MSIVSRTIDKIMVVINNTELAAPERLRAAISEAVREALSAEIRYTRRETSSMLKDALEEGVRQLRSSADTFEMFLETIKEPEEEGVREEAKCSHCDARLSKVSFVCELVFCDKKCEGDWHTMHDPDPIED